MKTILIMFIFLCIAGLGAHAQTIETPFGGVYGPFVSRPYYQDEDAARRWRWHRYHQWQRHRYWHHHDWDEDD